ncbi:MAG: glycoside hydrolase [bacterium]
MKRSVYIILLLEVSFFLMAKTSIERKGESWILDNGILRVTVDAPKGILKIKDLRKSIVWEQPERNIVPERAFRDVRQIPDGISFTTSLPQHSGKLVEAKYELILNPHLPQIQIKVGKEEEDAPFAGFYSLEPFLTNFKKGVIAITDYCDGHLYPIEEFPHYAWAGGRLDMPWIGICDLESGAGYSIIIDTSDDATIYFPKFKFKGKELSLPQIYWEPSKGKFSYPREIILAFTSEGSYVSLAKAYREYAKSKGLIVPFSEKVRKNQNIRRLFGAPDVWFEWDRGDYLSFALEAKTFGVEKMLLHGRSSPENLLKVNSLGYITSEYDNYTDILPLEEGKGIDSSHGRIPEDVVLMANGQRMTAWLTWDKKTQYMKRCPALWREAAQQVIPNVLGQYPFIGRFIDVTTAEGLYECYDENHPLTRGGKRQCGVDLLSYVRSLRLVVGGEHGIWWAVPHLDYIEGMMSCNPFFSWPAGHLIRPKSKKEEFTDPWGHKLPSWETYEKWGIGHKWRAPLWELVFHDCITSTWYWGDSTDFLLESAPEITPKKNAFNILYGTIPMFWSRTWNTNRDLFLKSYRITCKLHEQIADKEMLKHEFLTEDHDVQRTIFSDGTEIIVNFGEKPYELKREGKGYLLPQNGFFVKGPNIEQFMALINGKLVTSVKAPGYKYSDEGGVEVEMVSKGMRKIMLHIGSGKEVLIKPGELSPLWDVESTRIFVLDKRGVRREEIKFKKEGDGIRIGPFEEFTNLEMICGGQ